MIYNTTQLSVSKQSIKELLQRNNFVIPYYQRPYSWEEDQCQTLWTDLLEFATNYNNEQDKLSESLSETNKNSEKEYFLGAIVFHTVQAQKEKEVIDGQQRLITLILLLKAFYVVFKSDKNDRFIQKLLEDIEKCIWQEDETYCIQKENLKLTSNVITDDDKEELIKILREDIREKESIKDCKSKYAENYIFFIDKIDQFLRTPTGATTGLKFFPKIILEKCILLPVETSDFQSALDIFSTLNDRGLSLSNSDIFKAQLYKFYSTKGKEKRKNFLNRWSEITDICKNLNISVDELFMRYIYYILANKGNIPTTLKSIRSLYSENNYEILHDENLIENIWFLAYIWEAVQSQNSKIFSKDILKKFFILNYAPTNLWRNLVSVYFLIHKPQDLNKFSFLTGTIEEELCELLDIIISFILVYGFYKPGNDALKYAINKAMTKIVNKEDVGTIFSDFVVKTQIRNYIDAFDFSNRKPMTKFILMWWIFYYDKNQELLKGKRYHIEHILAVERAKEINIEDDSVVEALGNKTILEGSINSSIGKEELEDKIKLWNKKGTQIFELREFEKKYSNKKDFTKENINERTEKIISEFIKDLENKGLLIKVITLSDDEPFTHKKIKSFILFGETIEVKSMADMFVKVIKKLCDKDSEILYKEIYNNNSSFILSKKGRDAFINTNPDRADAIKTIKEDDIYINTNSDSNTKIKQLRCLFDQYEKEYGKEDISQDSLSFILL